MKSRLKKLVPTRKVGVGVSVGSIVGILSALYFTVFHKQPGSEELQVWFPMAAGVISHFIAAWITPSKKAS